MHTKGRPPCQPTHLTIDNQPIAHTTSPGDGLPALLIHGNSSSNRTFQPQLASELGRRHRLIAIDLPGFGDSQPIADPEQGPGIQGCGWLVVKVVAALELNEVALVGRSLGRHVALEAADDIPGCQGALLADFLADFLADCNAGAQG